MDNTSVDIFVLDFLQGSATPQAVREMLKKTKTHTKTQLNSCLYRLLKSGEVVSTSDTPPRWEINKEFVSVENKNCDGILTLLADTAMTARELSSKLDVETSKVNSVLYRLEKSKHVMKTEAVPPVWSLRTEKDNIIDEIHNKLQSLSLDELKRLRETI